jgi:hypothetical protein
LIAKHEDYITGYPDSTFAPNKTITRGEMASIISRLLKLTDSKSSERFSDYKKLPSWAVGAIGAVKDISIMKGYDNNAFESNKVATRAEAVVTLDRALNYKKGSITYVSAGLYGPDQGVLTINGDVIVEAADVSLQNMRITGSLLLAKGIGEGNVDLTNIIVDRKTSFQGGGSNSIHIKDSSFHLIEVKKDNNPVRIVFKGSNTVESLALLSSVKVEKEDQAALVKFDNVTIGLSFNDKTTVDIDGTVRLFTIGSKNTILNLNGGTIHELDVTQYAGNTHIVIKKNVQIDTVVLDSVTTIEGTGSIESLVVNINGTNVDIQPAKLEIKAGVTGIVGGKKKTEADSTVGSVPPTNSVPGLNGGFPPYNPPANQGKDDEVKPTPSPETVGPTEPPAAPSNTNLVFTASQTLQLGTALTLNQAPSLGVTAWLAPNGTSSFSCAANYMNKKIAICS